MFRAAFTVFLLSSFVSHVCAQDQTRNLFPGDTPAIGQAVKDSANNLYKGTQQAAKQTAHQTINAAKATANETRGSWTRFLEPQQPQSQTLIDRWNQGTKDFLSKTKQALSPPPIDKPLINLPGLAPGRGGLFQNVKLPALPPITAPRAPKAPVSSKARNAGQPRRSLIPAIFSREPVAPPKPRTVQDWMGQDRPQ